MHKQEQLHKAEDDLKETRANYCHPIGCDACPLYEDGFTCKAMQQQTIIHNLAAQIKGRQSKQANGPRKNNT